MPRKLLVEELNRYGYGYCSSVKKTTHALLFGRDGKQNKLTKAKADGMLVMDVSECRTVEELQRILLLNLDG